MTIVPLMVSNMFLFLGIMFFLMNDKLNLIGLNSYPHLGILGEDMGRLLTFTLANIFQSGSIWGRKLLDLNGSFHPKSMW